MSDTPYENLDVGYFEFPIPNTEEFQTVRFLNKEGIARLWAKIGDKFFRVPSGGTTGQALVKNENGTVSWGDVASDVPNASTTQYGIVKFISDEDFKTYMGIS